MNQSFQADLLEFEMLTPDSTPSEAWGKYDTLQFYLYARYNYWSCAVNKIGQSDPSWVSDLEDHRPESRADIYGPKVLADFEKSLVLSVSPYGEGQYSASYMAEDEIVRIVSICIKLYLHGERSQSTLTRDAFEAKAMEV